MSAFVCLFVCPANGYLTLGIKGINILKKMTIMKIEYTFHQPFTIRSTCK